MYRNLYKNLKFLVGNKNPRNFASLLNVSEQTVIKWVESKEKPTLEQFLEIGNVSGYTLDDLINSDLQARSQIRPVKAIFLDVDGVMTDGGMYYSEKGDELKKFHTRDGIAIKKMVKKGFITGFISSGFNSSLINSRAQLLGVHKTYTGEKPKTGIMDQWLSELDLKYTEIAYIGDDENDLPLIEKAGFTACPSDATLTVRQSVDLILNTAGGFGCVREFTDRYLFA